MEENREMRDSVARVMVREGAELKSEKWGLRLHATDKQIEELRDEMEAYKKKAKVLDQFIEKTKGMREALQIAGELKKIEWNEDAVNRTIAVRAVAKAFESGDEQRFQEVLKMAVERIVDDAMGGIDSDPFRSDEDKKRYRFLAEKFTKNFLAAWASGKVSLMKQDEAYAMNKVGDYFIPMKEWVDVGDDKLLNLAANDDCAQIAFSAKETTCLHCEFRDIVFDKAGGDNKRYQIYEKLGFKDMKYEELDELFTEVSLYTR